MNRISNVAQDRQDFLCRWVFVMKLFAVFMHETDSKVHKLHHTCYIQYLLVEKHLFVVNRSFLYFVSQEEEERYERIRQQVEEGDLLIDK